MNGMEYTDEVVAQIREGKSPMELAKEQAPSRDDTKRVAPDKTSRYEKTARADGWVSKDEWVEQGKDPDQWVASDEFVRRGELMERIKSQSKALKASEKRINEAEERIKLLAEHNKKIAQIEYEKAKKALRAKKIEALDEQDHAAVLDIDDQLNELEEQAKAVEETAEQKARTTVESDEGESTSQDLPPAMQDWLASDDSRWYREDPILQAAANSLAEQYAAQHFDMTGSPLEQDWDSLLDDVESKLRKRFPGDFKAFDDNDDEYEEEEEVDETPKARTPVAKQRRRSQQVAEPGQSGGRARGGKRKLSLSDLPAEAQKTHNEFVTRQGIMTTEEFLEQYEAVQDL